MAPLTLSGRALVLVALVVIAAVVGKWLDRDDGGYGDSFSTKITTSDKLYHACLGALLMFALARVMPPVWAFAGVVVAGAGWELGQGFFSWRDWLSDIGGAGVAFGVLVVT